METSSSQWLHSVEESCTSRAKAQTLEAYRPKLWFLGLNCMRDRSFWQASFFLSKKGMVSHPCSGTPRLLWGEGLVLLPSLLVSVAYTSPRPCLCLEKQCRSRASGLCPQPQNWPLFCVPWSMPCAYMVHHSWSHSYYGNESRARTLAVFLSILYSVIYRGRKQA